MAKLQDLQKRTESFLEFLCKRVDLKKLVESLCMPIENEESIILPQSFFNRVDREFVITMRMLHNKDAVDDSD